MIPGPEQIVRTTVTLDGRRVSALVASPAAGPARDAAADLPPVVAVHGFGSSAHHTFAVTGHLRELSRAGRTVIAPDLWGHGASAKPHDASVYRLDALIELVGAVTSAVQDAGDSPSIPAVDAAGCDLLGYSLGARVSAEALATGRWRRAVLGGYDGRQLFDGVDVAALRWALERDGLWEPHESSPSVLDGQTARIAHIAAAVPGNDPVALVALIEGLTGVPAAPVLPDRPVLLVAGAADPLAAGAGRLAAASPRATLLTVPGRDHISTVPAKSFRTAAAQFLGSG